MSQTNIFVCSKCKKIQIEESGICEDCRIEQELIDEVQAQRDNLIRGLISL